VARQTLNIVQPHEAGGVTADLAIVIDVLRATTTAAVLCERLGELCVIASPADLGQLPVRPYAMFSELADLVVEMPRYDNSPVRARSVELGGRTPILVTTNGTLAVAIAARCAPEVVLASFVNVSAVVEYAKRFANIVAIPAGHIPKQQRCSEDDACAEVLAARVAGTDDTLAARIAACRADPRILRRQTEIGVDVELCFDVDAVPVVPRVIAQAGWYSVHRGAGFSR
jgi:phosphosulfolactate phosphohydrolase-like enzyme